MSEKRAHILLSHESERFEKIGIERDTANEGLPQREKRYQKLFELSNNAKAYEYLLRNFHRQRNIYTRLWRRFTYPANI